MRLYDVLSGSGTGAVLCPVVWHPAMSAHPARADATLRMMEMRN
jgi:hypothetical protein